MEPKVQSPLDKKEEEIIKEDGSVDINVTDAPDGSIEEVVEPAEEVVEPVEKPAEREEKDKIARDRDAAYWHLRRLEKENEELKKSSVLPKKEERKVEELESDLAKQPVSTIKEMIREEARRLIDEDRQKSAYFSTFEKTLEDSKTRALKRHPELEDSASIKSQVMLEILNKRPDLVNNPHGPIIAMTEMEEELERRGYKDKPAPRSVISSLPQSRVVSQTNKTVTLTREDLDFCKEHKLDPKTYAQSKLRSARGSVSVEV